MDEYINGFVERTEGNLYLGRIDIDGVSLDDIECSLFSENGKNYIWLRRRPMLVYDAEMMVFKKRERRPTWEVYLEKHHDSGVTLYKGEFAFLRFRYSIVGVWDRIIGDNNKRLNLFVERLPMSQQTIINGINERKRQIK